MERALGYRFADRSLMERALTHSSSINELPGHNRANNERLEFLGDSILGWLVSAWLFERFPDFTEGQLSLVKNRLVSAAHLLDAAQRLNLGEYLELGRGEESAGGRGKQRLLVNAFEAVLAAVYLDGNADVAKAVLVKYALPADDVIREMAGAGAPHDFRAELEKLSRDRNLPPPVYLPKGESGPGHARRFTVEVRAGAGFIATGEGSSRKSACHNAAREVCKLIRGSAG